MPEFHLDHGNEEGSRNLSDLDEFTYGYVEAMFFTETSDSDDEYADATVADISDGGWEKIKSDCQNFQIENDNMLQKAFKSGNYDVEKAGRDFWYTRNGHGVGYWDRGLDEAVANSLSEAARTFGEAYIDDVLGSPTPEPKPY